MKTGQIIMHSKKLEKRLKKAVLKDKKKPVRSLEIKWKKAAQGKSNINL